MKRLMNKWILVIGVLAVVGFAASDSYAWSPSGHGGGSHGSYDRGGGYGHGGYGHGGYDRGHGWGYGSYYGPSVYVSAPYYYYDAPVVYDAPCYAPVYVAPSYYRPYYRPTFRFSVRF